MPSLSRRDLLQALALLPACQIASAAKLRKANLGFQLYTVRNIFTGDPAKVLGEIRAIGYSEIEATADTLAKAWPAIQNSGLKPTSVHLNLDPSDELLADVKAKGFEYAVIPYVPPAQRGDAGVTRKLAAGFQRAGKRAASHGLQLCYHNHAFEYEPMDGTTPLEIIMGETDPKLVQLELDIFWAAVAGLNPVDVLKKYHGRVPLIHVKNKVKGTVAAIQYNEKVPKEAFGEAGNGSIDIPSVLKAADAAGVRHYFVEQDQSPDPIASLRQSYEYLSKQF